MHALLVPLPAALLVPLRVPPPLLLQLHHLATVLNMKAQTIHPMIVISMVS
jgi:hypothetical protein